MGGIRSGPVRSGPVRSSVYAHNPLASHFKLSSSTRLNRLHRQLVHTFNSSRLLHSHTRRLFSPPKSDRVEHVYVCMCYLQLSRLSYVERVTRGRLSDAWTIE